ncbi:MAG: trigger factor [Culicoidibacterales bacterium]
MSKFTSEIMEAGRVKITMPVEKALFEKGMDQAFNKVKDQVKIDGFRKGKITRSMFEQRFGAESLYTDAVDSILQELYMQAIDALELTPVAAPKIDIVSFEVPDNVVLTAEVVVKPEVKLGDYTGLGVKKPAVRVTEKDIDEEIASLQKANALLVLKEGGKVETGDTAIIDFEGFKDGVAFEGGKGENHPLEIGSGQFIPGFEEKLVGMTEGEERDIEVTFPEAYHAAELAGAPVTFKVKVHEIKTRELPEVDVEFIKELKREGIETLEQLRADVKETIRTRKQQDNESKYRTEVVGKVVENATLTIQSEMIDEQVNRMVSEFEQQLSMQGMKLADYIQFTGATMEAMRKDMAPQAEQNIRETLVLEAIADAENIEITDADLDVRLQEMADMYQMKLSDIKQYFGSNTDSLKYEERIKKATEFLLDNNKA